MVKKCPICNKFNQDQNLFCVYCGEKLILSEFYKKMFKEVIETKLEAMQQSLFTFVTLCVGYYAIGVTLSTVPSIFKPQSMQILEYGSIAVGTVFIILAALSFFKYRKEFNKYKYLIKKKRK